MRSAASPEFLHADPAADEHEAPAGRPAAVTSTGSIEVGPTSASTGESSPSEPQSALNTGLRWNMIGRPVIEAANLLSVVVLARLVAPAEFGRYSIALIVLLLACVPTQAVMYALVQRDQLDRDHLKTGQTLAILLGLAVCAFCVAASYTIVPILFGARTAALVRLMLPACLINSVNTVQYALITRRLEFGRLSVFDMTVTLVCAAVSIPLAATGLRGEALVIGVDAGSVAGFILTCWWILPPIPNFRLRAARDILRPGIPAASNAASLICFQNCDYVIIGARIGPLSAGYYFRAYTLGVVYQMKVSQLVTNLGFPVLSRVSPEAVNRIRQRMVQTITLILFPLLTALTIVAPKFVTWFYGPAWHPVIVPVQILTFGGAAMLVAQTATVALLSTGQARTVMLWGWGHFVVYGGVVFAVARLGLPAVAIAAVTVHIAFLILSYVLLTHGQVRLSLKALFIDVLPAGAGVVGLAAVAVPVSVLTINIPVLLYLIIVAIAGGAGYFLTLHFWFPTDLERLGALARRLLPARILRCRPRLPVRLSSR